ncbi:MAG TPA: hypothetical protein EYO45_07040 [Candidatus Marinimicrobia bacterium]|nr:hypothetical protein [Candidatus Neomarinimicrobiota bacterium]
MLKIFNLLICFSLLEYVIGQQTSLIKSIDLLVTPGGSKEIGTLEDGIVVTKLKRDPSGKYVKISLEGYVLADALKDANISLSVGDVQIADQVKYKLLNARINGKKVFLKVQVTNQRFKVFDFTAITLLKVYGDDGNQGELNPFESINTVVYGLEESDAVDVDLVFDFEESPKNIELRCISEMTDGEKVFFRLGF